MHDALRQAAEKLRAWRHDPVRFVREEFKAEPDPWQLEGLVAFGDAEDPRKRRIAVKANKGPGKTAWEAWCIWHFLLTRGGLYDHPKGAATAITEKNIDDNLWPELAKWQQRSPILQAAFDWTKNRIAAKDHPATWFFSKRTWAKSSDTQQQANTLAGLHAKHVLAVLDESGGIPGAVMATAEAILATIEPGGFKKILQAGNPTHLEGPLYDAATRHRDKWYVITITGDPDNPKRSPRISVEWAREQIEMYGRDNPWVLVNVFGEFPPSSLNTLLGPDDVERAMHRNPTPDAYQWAQRRIGIDVARFGDDRTVLFPRQGIVARRPLILRQRDTAQIAARAMLAIRNYGADLTLVDDTGHWGHGVLDNLNAAGLPVVPVVFSAPGIDKRYANRRAEGWIKMANWVLKKGRLPRIPELQAELTTPTYTFVNGVFQLEPKDLIKKRLGRSPDLADALAITFMLPEMPRDSELTRAMARGARRRREVAEPGPNEAEHEYNPLAEVS